MWIWGAHSGHSTLPLYLPGAQKGQAYPTSCLDLLYGKFYSNPANLTFRVLEGEWRHSGVPPNPPVCAEAKEKVRS